MALTTLTAHACHELPPDRRINRAYAHSVLKPLLPSLLLGIVAATSLADALALIARHTFRHRPGLSKQRKPRSKPHKSMTQKTLLKDLHFLTWVDWVQAAPVPSTTGMTMNSSRLERTQAYLLT